MLNGRMLTAGAYYATVAISFKPNLRHQKKRTTPPAMLLHDSFAERLLGHCPRSLCVMLGLGMIKKAKVAFIRQASTL